jgi:hypothetical protein
VDSGVGHGATSVAEGGRATDAGAGGVAVTVSGADGAAIVSDAGGAAVAVSGVTGANIRSPEGPYITVVSVSVVATGASSDGVAAGASARGLRLKKPNMEAISPNGGGAPATERFGAWVCLTILPHRSVPPPQCP